MALLINTLFGNTGTSLNLGSQASATMQDRYNQVKGKTESELAAMGLKFEDGTYWKITSPTTSESWLTKNNIDAIAGRWEKLLDSNGNYMYPIDIPQDIMGDVVNQYGSTLSKDELIKMARDVYKKTGSNLTDQKIQSAIDQTHQEIQKSNPSLGDKLQQAVQESADKRVSIQQSGLSESALTSDGQGKSKSFLSKYGIWLIGSAIVIVSGIFLFKSKKA